MKEEEIKEYIEELESLFDLCDASDAYESLQGVKQYIENLQSQLKAKEEVIKEAREVISKMINTGYSDGTTLYFSTSNKSEFGVRAKIIDEILSKGENK